MLVPITPAPTMTTDGICGAVYRPDGFDKTLRVLQTVVSQRSRGPVAPNSRFHTLRRFAVCGADARHGGVDAHLRRERAGATPVAHGARVLRDDRGGLGVAGRVHLHVLRERRGRGALLVARRVLR